MCEEELECNPPRISAAIWRGSRNSPRRKQAGSLSASTRFRSQAEGFIRRLHQQGVNRDAVLRELVARFEFSEQAAREGRRIKERAPGHMVLKRSKVSSHDPL
jgi:hypothetical protein